MRRDEIRSEIEVLKTQNLEYQKLIKKIEKQVRKNLFWWWFIPLFGFLIYAGALQKRQQSEEYKNDSLMVKTELIKNEFAILKLEKELKKENPDEEK